MRMRRGAGVIFSKLFLILAAQPAFAAHWEDSAIKLRAEPALRAEGIQELKKMSELDEGLRLAFGRRSEVLTYEVISALDLKKFFPRLIGLVEKSKGEKLNWRLVTSTNSLVSIEDRKRLIAIYESKLREKDVPPPALLALISGLERVDHQIQKSDLEDLLKHSSFEVRLASIQAASNCLLKDASYGSVLVNALSAAPYQARFFAHEGLIRKPAIKEKYRIEMQKACAKETNEKVKALCREEG